MRSLQKCLIQKFIILPCNQLTLLGNVCQRQKANIRAVFLNRIPMAGEAWVGKIPFWGRDYRFNRHIDEHAAYLKGALEMNAFLNFYVFCGGTNFGFYNGAVMDGHRYELVTTSYDYDAPMSDLKKLSYGKQNAKKDTPAFYRGRFCAESGIDTFIDTRMLKKGGIFLNGFNLGRYWEIGPQHTLYAPGDFIRKENIIEIFELYAPEAFPQICATDSPVFMNKNGVYKNFDQL